MRTRQSLRMHVRAALLTTVGYDWHKGYQNATNEAHVFIHPVNPEDIKKRPAKT